jgi:hypothetical protein
VSARRATRWCRRWCRHRPSAGGSPALSDGCRRPGQRDRGGGRRGRSVRLRDADQDRPARNGIDGDRQIAHQERQARPRATSPSMPIARATCVGGTPAATSVTSSRSANPRPRGWSACTTSAGRCS